jgi:hypothetical protein
MAEQSNTTSTSEDNNTPPPPPATKYRKRLWMAVSDLSSEFNRLEAGISRNRRPTNPHPEEARRAVSRDGHDFRVFFSLFHPRDAPLALLGMRIGDDPCTPPQSSLLDSSGSGPVMTAKGRFPVSRALADMGWNLLP